MSQWRSEEVAIVMGMLSTLIRSATTELRSYQKMQANAKIQQPLDKGMGNRIYTAGEMVDIKENEITVLKKLSSDVGDRFAVHPNAKRSQLKKQATPG